MRQVSLVRERKVRLEECCLHLAVVMEIPRRSLPDDLAPQEHVQRRVQVSRALSEWRSTRRLSRTGGASYRDVRDARRAYVKAQRKLDQVCTAAQEGLITVPAP